MKTKLLIIPLAIIFLISLVSAASVVTNIFYDSTAESSLEIPYGDQVGVIISADSIFEPSMEITLKILDSSGNTVTEILRVTTTNDEYSNHLTFGSSAYSSAGEYTIVATVTAASGQTDSDELYLNVLGSTPGNNAPVITSSPVTEINETEFYEYQVTATDADGDSLSYSLTQAPEWLSIDSSTGLISGIAPEVDSDNQYVATVRVSDGSDFDTQTFTIDVLNVETPENNAPVAQNSSITTGFENSVMISLQATDEDGDSLTFEIISNPSNGVLSGFNSSTGQITYTPDNSFSGSDSFTFRANDGVENSNVATVSITVNSQQTNNPPVITSSPVTEINESEDYEYQVTATDEDGDTLRYYLTQSPEWLSINSDTGLISGIAPEVDSDTEFNVILLVVDGNGQPVNQSYVLTVLDISEDNGDDDNVRRKPSQDKETPFIFDTGEDRDNIVHFSDFGEITLTEEKDKSFNKIAEGILIWLLMLIILTMIVIMGVYLYRNMYEGSQ